MDERFRAAQAAIDDANLVLFESLLAGDPGLATARSRCSHPTLLQCVVLTISEEPHLEASIRALAENGAELTDPLIAACGVDNVRAAAALLDLGANIEGNGRWSPLEEALYWHSSTRPRGAGSTPAESLGPGGDRSHGSARAGSARPPPRRRLHRTCRRESRLA
jgi:hypothetical protein